MASHLLSCKMSHLIYLPSQFVYTEWTLDTSFFCFSLLQAACGQHKIFTFLEIMFFTRSFSSMVAGASFFHFLFFVVIRIHSGAPGEGLVWMVVVVGMMKNIKRHWFDVAHRSVQGFTEQKRASFSVLSGFSWNFFTATEYKNRKKNNKTKHIRRWVISSEYSKPQSTERTKKIIYNSIITPHEGEPATDVTLSSSIQQH